MKKRFWSAVLAVCMLLTLLPVPALAASVADGTCGASVNWTLDDAGTLTISGTGAMEDYSFLTDGTPVPWASHQAGVKAVEIENGVTSIGSCVFRDCNNLTSVKIPSSVTSIGAAAFHSCINLTNVVIPASVTSIGDFAFEFCTGLASVNIPNGVTSIGNRMFYECTGLTSITLPSSVTSIEDGAFMFSGLTSVTILSNVTKMGADVFNNCSALKDVFYESNPDKWANIGGNGTGLTGNTTIHYTATLTKGTESTANGKIAIMSDTDFNPTEAEKPENYTVSVESAARSGSVTVSSAAVSGNERTLTLEFSGDEENPAPVNVSVLIPQKVFAVSVQNDSSITVENLRPVPDQTPVLPETPESTPTSSPSKPSPDRNPGPVSTPKPTPTGPRVERVEDEVQVQTPPPVGISGQGESEYQEIVKDGEYTRWIDRVDLPDYANNLYTMLCIGGDYDEQYDLLIDDKYYRFPTGGGSKGTSEVESVLELVSDLDLPYSSGGGVFQESHFTGGYDTVDASLGDKAVQYAALKEGDLVRTSTYNAIYVSKVAKSSPSYDADLKAACAYAQSAFQAFDRDHPEIFWLSGRSKLRMVTVTLREGTQTYQETYIFFVLADKDGFTIRDSKYPNQAVIEADILRRDQAVGAILSTVTATTPHEQAAQLNRWLTEHNEYNTSQDLQNIPNWPHECLSALVGSAGTEGPVCDGYARAFQVLCGKLGITCVLVDGYAKVKADSAGEFHMWNSVQMPDGKWYGVDVTWNDPTVKGVSGPKSGYEREDFLMIGADTVVLGLKFSESHPPKNRAADGAVAFLNGPTLNTAAYNPMSAASVLPFVDVKPEAWYYDAVSDVFEQGLMTGKSDTVFGPQDGMTRAMAWTVLGRMSGEELAGGGTPWYQEAQTWAVAESLSDGSAPERTLSREELVTMLWRAEGSPAAEADLSTFTDGETVSDWAVPAVRWAVSEDILKGSNGKLNPSGTASRAEVASLLTRFHGRAE